MDKTLFLATFVIQIAALLIIVWFDDERFADLTWYAFIIFMACQLWLIMLIATKVFY